MDNLNVNDVVQINPLVNRFGGCFMQVTEVKSWGAQGFVKVPAEGKAFFRVKNEDMEYIGPATWMSD